MRCCDASRAIMLHQSWAICVASSGGNHRDNRRARSSALDKGKALSAAMSLEAAVGRGDLHKNQQ